MVSVGSVKAREFSKNALSKNASNVLCNLVEQHPKDLCFITFLKFYVTRYKIFFNIAVSSDIFAAVDAQAL